jgi:DNA repair exonuclease SbcCD ATPase subunit
MLIFKKIRFKNFISFPQEFTEINLNENRTTILIGPNGHGKSTICDALSFVLYGKPFRRINKPQLVNSINNKNLLVEIEFSANSIEYVIKRGIKPIIFEIWENGIMINQDSASKDYQLLLEQNILKMNYMAFTQIVLLGKATYVPFMQLRAMDRRNIIEDLLGLKIFSKMNDALKNNVYITKETINISENDVLLIKEKIKIKQKYIMQLENDRNTNIETVKTEIKSLEDQLEHYNILLTNAQSKRIKLVELLKPKSKFENTKKTLTKFQIDFNSKIDRLQKEVNFLNENNTCPMCFQLIEESFKEDKIKGKTSQKIELELDLKKLNQKINNVSDTLDEFDIIMSEISGEDIEINRLLGSIKELNNILDLHHKKHDSLLKIYNNEISEYKELEEYNVKLEVQNNKLLELKTDLVYYQGINQLLKDDGVKSIIVKKYLVIFNNLINEYLSKLGFFVKFTLNETFEEKILFRHMEEYSYESFSEGEKIRINLAILLTWREISKLKNNMKCNLLIMDEIFDSSLDQSGIDSFIDLIPTIDNINLIVISHTPDKLIDKFDKIIEFSKKGNFSRVS